MAVNDIPITGDETAMAGYEITIAIDEKPMLVNETSIAGVEIAM